MPNQQTSSGSFDQNGKFSGVIDLLNQSYQSKSVDQNQTKLVNMYLESDAFKGKFNIVAFPTPGLSLFCDTEQATVRALLEQNEVTYAVAGNKFYSIASNGTKTLKGTLNTSSGFAKMVSVTGGSSANNQIVIIDGTNGYHYNIGTDTATFPITDEDFIDNASDITAQDDYFIVQHPDSITFAISNLSDGLTWNALDFASKTGTPDRLIALCSHKRKLYLLGSKSIEIWYNSGNVDFPFERYPDVFLTYGCAAKESVVAYGNYIMLLSKTARGGYSVIALQDYQPNPVSTFAIDYQISQMTSKSDAKAYCYVKDGHEFYELTFPTDGVTFTFNITTQTWTNRQSYIGGSYTRFLGNCSCFCYDKNLIGDYRSGKIYTQSSSVYTENGTAIRRLFESPPVYIGGKRIFISRLMIELETNVGTGKTFTVEKSIDDGRSWTTLSTLTIGADNNFRHYINGVGSARTFRFRISTTTDANFTILGFVAEATIGAH